MNLYATVEVRASELNKLSQSIRGTARGLRQAAHLAMANQLYQCTMDNFGAAGSFRPHRWSRLTPAYAKKVNRDYATLEVSGALKHAIQVGADATKGHVSVSDSDNPYALVHQHGGGNNIPARPYFPVHSDGEVVKDVERLVVEAARLAVRTALANL